MELLQLRYFLDSAENENFSKTAEKYMVPASCVSIAVKKLEKELGCSLFDRQSNKIKLNDNGRLFHASIKNAISEIDNAVYTLSEFPNNKNEDIFILIRSERRVIGEQLLRFKEQYPNVVLHLSHDFNTRDFEKYDLIIDEQTDNYKGFDRLPLLIEKLYFVANKSNPISNKKLTLSQLCDQPFISMCEGSSLKRLTLEYCKKAGFAPNIVIESDDPYYIRNYLELNLGIALIPEISWKGQLSNDIVFLDVVDFKQSRITYVYQSKQKLASPLVTKLYRFLSENSNIK